MVDSLMKNTRWMESGQRPVLRDAMEDVAKTVEYMLEYEERAISAAVAQLLYAIGRGFESSSPIIKEK